MRERIGLRARVGFDEREVVGFLPAAGERVLEAITTEAVGDFLQDLARLRDRRMHAGRIFARDHEALQLAAADT